jgi:HEAT repeat protein
VARDDKAYSVRGIALQSLGQLKEPGTAALLEKVLRAPSPHNVLQVSALRAMGALDDPSLDPTLLEWSAAGKPEYLRSVAIGALGRADRKNHDITARLIEYLRDSSFDIRFAAIFALGRRGDPTAIEPLEALLKSGQLSLSMPHSLEDLIRELKAATTPPAAKDLSKDLNVADTSASNQAVLERLDRLERSLTEMNERLRKIESALPSSKSD